MSLKPRRRRFNVDEFDAMVDAGILTRDDRVELIEGEILHVPPIGSRHAACVRRLHQLLVEQVARSVLLSNQSPLRLSDLSEPQPDIALLRARADFYAERHPRSDDVLLVVEVSHATLPYDRGTKLPLYAAAGVPEVWIVNVEGGSVEVYRDPSGGRFQDVRTAGRGEVLHPLELSAVAVPVSSILG